LRARQESRAYTETRAKKSPNTAHGRLTEKKRGQQRGVNIANDMGRGDSTREKSRFGRTRRGGHDSMGGQGDVATAAKRRLVLRKKQTGGKKRGWGGGIFIG